MIGIYVGVLEWAMDHMPKEIKEGYSTYLKEVYQVESVSEALMIEACDIRASMERNGL
jgi:hypothetical protein